MSLQSDLYYRPDIVHNPSADEYMVVWWDEEPPDFRPSGSDDLLPVDNLIGEARN